MAAWKGEPLSRTSVIRCRVRREAADENRRLVEAVYSALAEAKPSGLEYATYRLEDGVTFVHVARLPDTENPLAGIPAFAQFPAQTSAALRRAAGAERGDRGRFGQTPVLTGARRPRIAANGSSRSHPSPSPRRSIRHPSRQRRSARCSTIRPSRCSSSGPEPPGLVRRDPRKRSCDRGRLPATGRPPRGARARGGTASKSCLPKPCSTGSTARSTC